MSDSNDNLENFFKNRMGGEEHFKFREEDWLKMEKKLDSEMPVPVAAPVNKYLWMFAGAAIMATLFLAYFGIRSLMVPSTITEVKTSEPVQEKVEIAKPNTSQLQTVHQEKKEVTTNKTKEIALVNSKTPGTKTVENVPVSITQNETSEQVPVKETETAAVLSDLKNEDGEVSTRDVLLARAKPEEKNLKDANVEGIPYLIAEYGPAWVEPEKTVVNKEVQFRRLWALGITGALDASRTPESDWGKIQTRIGIYGEYFIASKWSIGIGANITAKKYSALGSEYSPPKGFWTYGIAPSSTYAKCEVLDVPLLVNYYLPVAHKSALKLQAGLSSWFMLTEHYWYKYEQNDPDLIKYWGTKNENKYWFSVVNLGVDYHYQLNQKWGASVGPYFNMPLGGIGHGNIKLMSAGLKASVLFNKYKPIIK